MKAQNRFWRVFAPVLQLMSSAAGITRGSQRTVDVDGLHRQIYAGAQDDAYIWGMSNQAPWDWA